MALDSLENPSRVLADSYRRRIAVGPCASEQAYSSEAGSLLNETDAINDFP